MDAWEACIPTLIFEKAVRVGDAHCGQLQVELWTGSGRRWDLPDGKSAWQSIARFGRLRIDSMALSVEIAAE